MEKYNLELIKARVCEKHKRILRLIYLLKDSGPNERLEQSLGAELCSSIQSSENLCELQDEQAFYKYKDGSCYFMIGDVQIDVADLRDMRKSKQIDKECYFDMCVLVVSYKGNDGIFMQHIIPDVWLYGSTNDEFNEYKPVHDVFVEAAKKYIEEHHITPDMQKGDDDDDCYDNGDW